MGQSLQDVLDAARRLPPEERRRLAEKLLEDAALRRVAIGEIEAHVTTVIVAERRHRRMVAEAIAKGLISSGQPLKKLKANPSVIMLLADYVSEVEKLLRLLSVCNRVVPSYGALTG